MVEAEWVDVLEYSLLSLGIECTTATRQNILQMDWSTWLIFQVIEMEIVLREIVLYLGNFVRAEGCMIKTDSWQMDLNNPKVHIPPEVVTW